MKVEFNLVKTNSNIGQIKSRKAELWTEQLAIQFVLMIP